VARIGVDLDLFNILSTATEPLTTENIAKKTGADPDIYLLARILRYMASIGMIREVRPGIWTQKNYGSNLTDARQSAGVCHALVFASAVHIFADRYKHPSLFSSPSSFFFSFKLVFILS
jgi:hypothetical protein